MALVDELTSLGNDLIARDLVNNWMDASAVVKRLKAKGKVVSSGNNLKFPIAYAENGTITWYTGSQEIPATEGTELTSVYFGWKQIGGQLVYTGTELIKNDGPTGIVNLVRSKKQNLIDSVQEAVADQIFNDGTNALYLDGLQLMCDSSGTYPNTAGGIATTDFAGWAANEDSSTTTLTRKALQDQILACAAGTSDRPTVLIMNQAVYGKLKSLLTPQERYTPADTMKVGFVNLTFDGIDVITDTHSTGTGSGTSDGHIYILNEKYVSLYINSHANFKFDAVMKPVNQDAYTQKLLAALSLTCTRRDRQGSMKTINPGA